MLYDPTLNQLYIYTYIYWQFLSKKKNSFYSIGNILFKYI